MEHEPQLPDGFVEHFRHQCPINPDCPQASGKWIFAARENKYRGRCFRGAKVYYDTVPDAIRGAIEEINRRLKQREKIKKYADQA